MTPPPHRWPYVARDPSMGPAGMAPMLPITLSRGPVSINVSGLLDTGSAINVLPYSVGLQFKVDWSRLPRVGPLAGILANVEARGLTLHGVVGSFPPVDLGFAWVRSDIPPVILGQMNFFHAFDVCFFRLRSEFEVRPASPPPP